MLCPVVPPAKKACYCYERYREAWNLLKKSRTELLQFRRDPPPPSHKKRPNPSAKRHEPVPGPGGTIENSPPVHWRDGAQNANRVP